jgi:hypothetical protein
MNFTIKERITDNYKNVVRLVCETDKSSGSKESEGHQGSLKLTIDVHKVVSDYLESSFVINFTEDYSEFIETADFILSSIVITFDNKQLFMSNHGPLILLENFNDSDYWKSLESLKLIPDKHIYCVITKNA